MPDLDSLRALHAALVPWYRTVRRDLPWRRDRDPYRVWVSEIMLQQTRAEAVIPFYERFLQRFPDVRALAVAPEEAVLEAWSGLGYYRRARMLHAAARQVEEVHDGSMPSEPDAVRALPGVGRYTSGAILSIAFDQPEPIVDGNVERVLTRYAGLGGDPRREPLRTQLWDTARQLAEMGSPGDVNQALMELGATVCRPATAATCEECPVRTECAARRQDRVQQLPELAPRKRPQPAVWLVALARRGGRLLFRRRPADAALLAGLWEFPTAPASRQRISAHAASEELRAAWVDELGDALAVGSEVHRHRQVITHRAISFRVHSIEAPAPPSTPEWKWWTPHQARGKALTTATRRVLDQIAGDSAGQARGV